MSDPAFSVPVTSSFTSSLKIRRYNSLRDSGSRRPLSEESLSRSISLFLSSLDTFSKDGGFPAYGCSVWNSNNVSSGECTQTEVMSQATPTQLSYELFRLVDARIGATMKDPREVATQACLQSEPVQSDAPKFPRPSFCVLWTAVGSLRRVLNI